MRFVGVRPDEAGIPSVQCWRAFMLLLHISQGRASDHWLVRTDLFGMSSSK